MTNHQPELPEPTRRERLLLPSGSSGIMVALSGTRKISIIRIVIPLSSGPREESKQLHDLEYLRYRLRNCLSPERLEELKKSQAERVQKWKTERHDGFRELLAGWVWDFAALLPADTPQELLRRLLHEHAELILNDSDTRNGVLSIAKKLSQEDYYALRISRRSFSANDIAGDVIAKLCGEAPHLDGVPSASATIGIAEAAADATTHALPIPEASVSTGRPADGATREAAATESAVRRNPRYEAIDSVLKEISEARPKNHEEVFRFLDERKVALPRRKLFKGGWLKGFQQNRPKASTWLSQAWGRLGLPAFARGPKK